MITHFIFMSSSYFLGTRIAIDYILEDGATQGEIKRDLDRIMKECGKDVSISTHMIQAESEKWKDVCEADYFFKDVKTIENIEEFIALIQKDRKLEGIDIAKYILSKIKCTQLKLQKLVYLCFADYLCDTNNKLFTDNIYAFQYGPLVDTVYTKYKKYGYKDIEEETEDIDSKNISEMPAKSRILFAEDGIEKIMSIEKTLKRYGNLTASELVELTHKEHSPWTMTIRSSLEKYSLISEDTIKKYHKFEIKYS